MASKRQYLNLATLSTITAFGVLTFLTYQGNCQYPGSTPARISADIGGVIATNVQPAPMHGNAEVNTISTNNVVFTLGNGGSQYPPNDSSQLNCTAYAPNGEVDTIYSKAIQGSASISFQWIPTLIGSYQVICSGGSGAYFVQNQNLVVDVYQ